MIQTLTFHEGDSLYSENYKMKQKAKSLSRIKTKEQGKKEEKMPDCRGHIVWGEKEQEVSLQLRGSLSSAG